MQMLMTFIAVVAGLIFSIAVALVAEEMIFGQVFRLFFARPDAQPSPSNLLPTAIKTGQKR
jgi:hypothetical protein